MELTPVAIPLTYPIPPLFLFVVGKIYPILVLFLVVEILSHKMIKMWKKKKYEHLTVERENKCMLWFYIILEKLEYIIGSSLGYKSMVLTIFCIIMKEQMNFIMQLLSRMYKLKRSMGVVFLISGVG